MIDTETEKIEQIFKIKDKIIKKLNVKRIKAFVVNIIMNIFFVLGQFSGLYPFYVTLIFIGVNVIIFQWYNVHISKLIKMVIYNKEIKE